MANDIRVGLFVTCIVDMFRPSVGFACIKLLEDNGCQVHVPVAQTCCGQNAWNCDDKSDARELAEEVILNFEDFDYIVVPSKPCAQMLKENYEKLHDDNPLWQERVKAFSAKTYELTQFLEVVLELEDLKSRLDKRADILTSNDLGELLEIAKNLKRQGIKKEVRHVAEVLSGMVDSPSIGGH